jgi:hypothetical protein
MENKTKAIFQEPLKATTAAPATLTIDEQIRPN